MVFVTPKIFFDLWMGAPSKAPNGVERASRSNKALHARTRLPHLPQNKTEDRLPHVFGRNSYIKAVNAFPIILYLVENLFLAMDASLRAELLGLTQSHFNWRPQSIPFYVPPLRILVGVGVEGEVSNVNEDLDLMDYIGRDCMATQENYFLEQEAKCHD
jgi:hypothetical protein